MRTFTRLLTAALGALMLAWQPACAQAPQADPFMGDWQGTLRLDAGGERPVCAQVICWGGEGYQANLLPAFDERVEPLAVLRGQREGDAVSFGEGGRIAEGVFQGRLGGDEPGAYEMKHVVRLSPTLGAEPPEGAVILLDGTSLDAWTMGEAEPFMVDLQQAVPGDNYAAYMRCRVVSPQAQPARLEMGSDDGIKAWVNGAVVHRNPANRPPHAWDDRVDIDLVEGPNTILLKILQGGGGSGGCARVIGRDGAALEGLTYEPETVFEPGTARADYEVGNAGAIFTWEVAGPYARMNTYGVDLVDVPFAPEVHPDRVDWKIANDHPRPFRTWTLVGDGAMEVVPGSGSLVTKQQFADGVYHVEFRTPFMPDGRGQGRGNSGVYLQGRYEIQVLDSYGLEGKEDECGGFYGVARPRVNMCAPPEQWQTYDMEFHAPRRDATGAVSPARVTVRHNGVLIHENVTLGGDLAPGQDVQVGGLLLQDHWYPVQYRNMWVAPLTPGASVTE